MSTDCSRAVPALVELYANQTDPLPSISVRQLKPKYLRPHPLPLYFWLKPKEDFMKKVFVRLRRSKAKQAVMAKIHDNRLKSDSGSRGFCLEFNCNSLVWLYSYCYNVGQRVAFVMV